MIWLYTLYPHIYELYTEIDHWDGINHLVFQKKELEIILKNNV
jgi:hypothetical protein